MKAIQLACQKYEKALFVNTDNVKSNQITIMRKEMRALGAHMVCGKNSMMIKALSSLKEKF